MTDITIGKNILENLTTGMYADSKVIYREYVQNACDQIDEAVELEILEKNEGQIDIELDIKNRNVFIRDNATGIKAADFQSQLGDIANSDKTRGESKGFRGIGRLCGLAYCETLVFRTSYVGESDESIMRLDAKKMREILADPVKRDVVQVLDEITKFEKKQADVSEHYFIVELLNINNENSELLSKKKVEEYLSFVAPVPYQAKFIFRTQVYTHAQELDQSIDEYKIFVQGNQIFKGYGTHLYREQNNKKISYDEITGIEFYDFYDNEGELLAWLWYGLCCFEGVIPEKANPMCGIRIRRHNIQIGGNDAIAHLFKEDRGYKYFVGELFAVHRELTPNSQRDYFNENTTRVQFEDAVRKYCYETLHSLYYTASTVRKSFKSIESYTAAVQELTEKTTTGSFINSKEKADLEAKVEAAKAKKEVAERAINKVDKKYTDVDSPAFRVVNKIKGEYEKKKTEQDAKQAEKEIEKYEQSGGEKTKYFTDSLTSLKKSDRKLVAQVIAIVSKHVDQNTIEMIKKDIVEELN